MRQSDDDSGKSLNDRVANCLCQRESVDRHSCRKQHQVKDRIGLPVATKGGRLQSFDGQSPAAQPASGGGRLSR